METKKTSIYKIPIENAINLSDYSKYRKFLECYLCKYLAVFPYFCETCNNSFCKKCVEILEIPNNKCPNCMYEIDSELRVSNEKFYDFFKDLMIKCDCCNENIAYPVLPVHDCFTAEHSKPEIIKGDADEYKLINNIIHFKCPKCKDYVENNKRDAHLQNCQVLVNPIINLPFSTNPPVLCQFCGKAINQSDQINHLTECPQFLSRINIAEKFKLIQPEQQVSGNVLEVIDNFNKLTRSLDTTNVQLLIATMNSLEKTISNFSQQTNASYCRNCKIILKNFELNMCKCCDKRYCNTCCVPCNFCDEIISKNCLFTCQNCKITKCPLCQIQTGNFCICLEHKVCKTCFNDPNINNINVALLKGPHQNCAYVKQLENNIYVVKIPKFNFRSEILLNSIKQPVSISLIKSGAEMFSRIFQIGVSDKFIFMVEGQQFKIGSSLDYWCLDLKAIEGGIDYMIINFNANPNYSYVLNKFNNTSFEQMNPANSVVTGAFGMFNVGKQLLANIIFQKV